MCRQRYQKVYSFNHRKSKEHWEAKLVLKQNLQLLVFKSSIKRFNDMGWRWQEVFVFISKHGLLIYFKIWYFLRTRSRKKRSEKNRNWCFISWNWLLYKNCFILWIWLRRWMKTKNKQEQHHSTKREMIYLSTFTFTIIPWNVRALSIHFYCNWSDHTAIGIVVSRRVGWGFVVILNFCWLLVHWLMLRTSHMRLNLFSTAHSAPLDTHVKHCPTFLLFLHFSQMSNDDEYLAN